MLRVLSRGLAGSRRACHLVLVLAAAPLLPPPHSPQPKSAVHPHLPLPTPARILVPTEVVSDFPGNLDPRASSLRFPLPWALCLFFVLGSWPLACGESLLRTVLPESELPCRAWLVLWAASHDRGVPLGYCRRETRHGDGYQVSQWTRLSTQLRRRHIAPWEWTWSAH